MCLIRGLGWVLKEDWQGFPKCNDQTAEIQTFKSLKWHIPVTLWTVAPQGFAELQYPAGPRRDAWLLVSGGWSFNDGWWICNMTSIIRKLFCLHSLLYSYMLCYLGAVPSSWLTFHDTKNWCTKECRRVLQWMEAHFKKRPNMKTWYFHFPYHPCMVYYNMYIYHKNQPFMYGWYYHCYPPWKPPWSFAKDRNPVAFPVPGTCRVSWKSWRRMEEGDPWIPRGRGLHISLQSLFHFFAKGDAWVWNKNLDFLC